MAKLLKIVGRTIGITVEWLLFLFIVFAFSIRFSAFQTYLGSLATSFFSKELKADFKIGQIDVVSFNKIILKDVFVKDQSNDTLALLKSIDVRVKNLLFAKNKIVIRSIALQKGAIEIKRDKKSGDYNYWFITDYFESGSSSTQSAMRLAIDQLVLNSVRVTYDDNRKGYSTFGMDYDHLSCDNVNLKISNLKTVNGDFYFTINHLSAREKCGFRLKHLQSNCVILDGKGLFLNQLLIRTKRTKLYSSKFILYAKTLAALQEIEDSVVFDAVIDSSRLDLKDVAYFGTSLEGMNQIVAFSGKLSRKVKNLKVSNVDLRFGKRSSVQGDFTVPDYRDVTNKPFKEIIRYAFIDLADLKALKLPKDLGFSHFSLVPEVERMGFVELKKSVVSGTTDRFTVASKELICGLGSIHIDNGIRFQSLHDGGYSFQRTLNSNFDIYIDSFQLGKMIANPMFDKVNGSFYLSGVVGQADGFRIEEITGDFHQIGFNHYNYAQISVEKASFVNNVFAGAIKVDDPHVQLVYEGSIDVSKQKVFDFTASIPKADIGYLNFVKDKRASFNSDIRVSMKGQNLSDFQGDLTIKQLYYQEKNKEISIPSFDLNVERSTYADRLTLTSKVASVELVGKVDPSTIYEVVSNNLAIAFPTLIEKKVLPKKSKKGQYFDLVAVVGNPDEVLAVFAPMVGIAPGTKLAVHFSDRENNTTLDITSKEIAYIQTDSLKGTTDRKYFSGITLNQQLEQDKLNTSFHASNAYWNDSLNVADFNTKIVGQKGVFTSTVDWNLQLKNPAQFFFTTSFLPNDSINFIVKPSYFTLKDKLWEIQNTAALTYISRSIAIDHLVFERDVQFITVNGVLSDKESDKVFVYLNDVQLEEFSALLQEDVNLKGKINGNFNFYTPFTTLKAQGEVTIQDMFVDDKSVGDITSYAQWDYLQERFVLSGDLDYLKFQTFNFSGYYYPFKQENDIDFRLDFKNTDIEFVAAFLDPEVISDVKGKLNGKITVNGNSSSPKIDGLLNLSQGGLKVGVLGTAYKLSGPILFSSQHNAFFINNMPVIDEEGNTAVLTSSINHEHFQNWSANIDLWFDRETVENTYHRSFTGRFLVLNTKYNEGEVYYGKGYATGFANIFIQDGQTDITLNAQTEKDTKITVPMYGPSEVSEFDFITIDVQKKIANNQVDLTGVNLDLNITATPQAEVDLVFNEKTGDAISARGLGPINITADNFGKIQMKGQYVVATGKYDFVLPPIKQQFTLVPGGSITWTGDPYEANLAISAYNKVNASIKELTADAVGGISTVGNEEVRCILNISNTISNPIVQLDIDVPSANEAGKQALSRIRSNPDDLQQQFFTLLVMKRFVPLNGQSNQGFGGATDVLAEQINSALDGLSKQVKFNVGYDTKSAQNGDASSLTRQTTVGFQTAVGENKSILISGAFGVANSSTGVGITNSYIGDMNIEYLINNDGSFRLKIFNLSNDRGVLTEKYKGDFTQGIGLHYQEQFNELNESKMVRSFGKLFQSATYKRLFSPILNLFRRKENKVFVRKGRNIVPLPTESQTNSIEMPIEIEPVQATLSKQ